MGSFCGIQIQWHIKWQQNSITNKYFWKHCIWNIFCKIVCSRNFILDFFKIYKFYNNYLNQVSILYTDYILFRPRITRKQMIDVPPKLKLLVIISEKKINNILNICKNISNNLQKRDQTYEDSITYQSYHEITISKCLLKDLCIGIRNFTLGQKMVSQLYYHFISFCI